MPKLKSTTRNRTRAKEGGVPPKLASVVAPVPATAGTRLGMIIKKCRNLMRKDRELDTDLVRLPTLTWLLFLKFLDDMEQVEESKARLAGTRFRRTIEAPYRWRDWAAPAEGLTGDDLIAFVTQEQARLPGGDKGLGLVKYLTTLRSSDVRRRQVVGTVFAGVSPRTSSGFVLRDVVNELNAINFLAEDDLFALGFLYESMLRELRDAAGQNGEFYTPRPVVRFMVEAINPRLGEIVLDPACGSGGFLVQAFSHLKEQVRTVADRRTLQDRSIRGCDPKALPYLLCQMNLLLHGMNAPVIDSSNSLAVKLSEIGDSDRVDVILTNPPFGGEEERGILSGFPPEMQTTETALLFLQMIMRRLKRAGSRSANGGRAGVIVPAGTLSLPGVAARIREQLLRDFSVRAIIRLPHNTFSPYTDIQANRLLFERGGPTDKIVFCDVPLPTGVTPSKSRPLLYEWLAPIHELIANGVDTDHSWIVRADQLDADHNLDIRNPRLRLEDVDPLDASVTSAVRHTSLLAGDLESARTSFAEVLTHVAKAPRRSLGEFTEESDERIGSAYRPDIRLLGVSNVDGLTLPKTPIGSNPSTYKVIQLGHLAYNPMRINVGSIGYSSDPSLTGITSPDYVVFRCKTGLDPEFLFYFLRSEAGRHLIQQKTKGSVRFRLYYPRLAMISIPIPDDVAVQHRFAEACRRLATARDRSQAITSDIAKALLVACREAFVSEPIAANGAATRS